MDTSSKTTWFSTCSRYEVTRSLRVMTWIAAGAMAQAIEVIALIQARLR